MTSRKSGEYEPGSSQALGADVNCAYFAELGRSGDARVICSPFLGRVRTAQFLSDTIQRIRLLAAFNCR